ncbi:MAG: alpha/beta hydrolase [Pantoea sp.]|uniref:alpha/beta hydrolase n=1 Tax=Pantoea sp. TaxID=69393 RepID=UPI00238DAFD8|nr:alpha/beta hydrolase [Pantoea sp.]MDE1187990.1 alpha/beta hydrolase [Pantoea sp.]
MNSYVLSVRMKMTGNVFGNQVGGVTYLEVPDTAKVPLPSHTAGTAQQWMTKVLQIAKPDNVPEHKRDIVFFVHGYNTSPEEALKRQRLAELKLNEHKFNCMVIGFDWPSNEKPQDYLSDRGDALDTAPVLVRGGIIPFTIFSKKDCPVNVHIMAHSMGAFVVREAFRHVDKMRDSDLANDWRIGQIALFAADISSSCFAADNADMLPVFNHCGRLTNYYSGFDEALAASNIKNIDLSSRVGRVGMPVDTPVPNKAVDVDCGARYQAIPYPKLKILDGMESHSWYLEDEIWYEDLAQTLSGSTDRNYITSRHAKNGSNDFELNTD